ncbi:helix-turn-helix domain-containing protein [Paraburkholderia sp. CNPSo 3274]|uniref:AraC family transcriptional regulator n=1 Tax=Paraburkholderia sp. CNPSo 3274 TaxID=2940932 RepID=UPI0020B7772D|nr:helix-turn-helix domain-containing protein [Paraburkholderia sp. CNPSo 3274]MCP3712207.1 helix-turn-helix domain-containing protein [Paraburkholderia sp. CNPSo 3274]
MEISELFEGTASQQLSVRNGSVAGIFGEQGSEIRSAGRYVFVSQGGVWVRVGRCAYGVSRHWGLWLPPAVVCFAYPMMDSSLVELGVPNALSRLLPSTVCVPRCPRDFCAALKEAGARERHPDAERSLESQLVSAITDALAIPERLVVTMPSYGSRLAVVCEAVLRNPSKVGQLDKTAAALGVSVRTLGRLFKEELGTSAANWRRGVQIAMACCALDNGIPASEVAAMLGYGAGAFSTFFRSRLGYSPREQALGRGQRR